MSPKGSLLEGAKGSGMSPKGSLLEGAGTRSVTEGVGHWVVTSPVSRSGKFLKNPLKSVPGSAII